MTPGGNQTLTARRTPSRMGREYDRLGHSLECAALGSVAPRAFARPKIPLQRNETSSALPARRHAARFDIFVDLTHAPIEDDLIFILTVTGTLSDVTRGIRCGFGPGNQCFRSTADRSQLPRIRTRHPAALADGSDSPCTVARSDPLAA